MLVRGFEQFGVGQRGVGIVGGVLREEREVHVAARKHAQLQQVADDVPGRQILRRRY